MIKLDEQTALPTLRDFNTLRLSKTCKHNQLMYGPYSTKRNTHCKFCFLFMILNHNLNSKVANCAHEAPVTPARVQKAFAHSMGNFSQNSCPVPLQEQPNGRGMDSRASDMSLEPLFWGLDLPVEKSSTIFPGVAHS